MEFNLRINLDNDAFNEAPEHELRKILNDVIGAIDNGYKDKRLFDTNGNKVGYFSIR